jgi:hypothetical protein
VAHNRPKPKQIFTGGMRIHINRKYDSLLQKYDCGSRDVHLRDHRRQSKRKAMRYYEKTRGHPEMISQPTSIWR